MIIHVTRTVEVAAATEATTTSDEMTDRIVADFRVTIGTMKCAMSERLVRLGISMAQLNIMYTLQRNGVMTMSHLADVLGVSLSNATGLVDRMEERGFIERSRVPEDRRVVLVQVTEAGTRMIQESDALSDELMRSVLARLDPAGAAGHRPRRRRGALGARGDRRPACTEPARSDHPHPAIAVDDRLVAQSLTSAARVPLTSPPEGGTEKSHGKRPHRLRDRDTLARG